MTIYPLFPLLAFVILLAGVLWRPLQSAIWFCSFLGILVIPLFVLGVYDYCEMYRLTKSLPASSPTSSAPLEIPSRQLKKMGILLAMAALVAYLVSKVVNPEAGAKGDSTPRQ
jgi:hypothetical protein